MSEHIDHDRAVEGGVSGGKTSRRAALKYGGLGALLGAGGLVGAAFGAAQIGLLDGPMRSILRGDGSRYRQAAWWSDIETDADMTKWPSFPGNPDTSRFDMDEWMVRFFSTPRAEYDDQSRELP